MQHAIKSAKKYVRESQRGVVRESIKLNSKLKPRGKNQQKRKINEQTVVVPRGIKVRK